MTNSNKKEKDSKTKIEISRRVTNGKKKPDLFAKFRNTDHPLDGLISDSRDFSDSIKENSTLPYPTVVEPTLPYPTLVQLENEDSLQMSASPTKNFTKFSNSIIKVAVPDGLFRGQSKHTYDVLYQSTRGAINPNREIQLTKLELVKLTGLEIKTIQRHLSFLRSVGLIVVDPKVGDHKGAIYQVLIPEEITLPYPTLVQYGADNPTVVESGVVYTPHPSINYTTLGLGNPLENTDTYEFPKTSLKTKKNDDEPLGKFEAKFAAASAKLTGKGLSKKEAENWEALADLLILELEIAARRAGTISNLPAFLTEVLRRKFFNQPLPKNNKVKIDTVGKNESGSYEIKSLDEKGRETALIELQEFADEDFLEDFKKWYTSEDWNWLLAKLRKSEIE